LIAFMPSYITRLFKIQYDGYPKEIGSYQWNSDEIGDCVMVKVKEECPYVFLFFEKQILICLEITNDDKV